MFGKTSRDVVVIELVNELYTECRVIFLNQEFLMLVLFGFSGFREKWGIRSMGKLWDLLMVTLFKEMWVFCTLKRVHLL